MATITGTAGDDTLFGTPGADVISGLAGTDYLNTGGGDDVLDGGDGFDTASFYPAASAVHVDLTKQGVAQDTGVGQMTLISIEAVEGSPYADVLTAAGATQGFRLSGGGGDDTLIGGSGADVLEAGDGGRATLTGGAGADFFIYDAQRGSALHTPGSMETITDFSSDDALSLADSGLAGGLRVDVTVQLHAGGGWVLDFDVGSESGHVVGLTGTIEGRQIVNAISTDTTLVILGSSGDDVLDGMDSTGSRSTASYALASAGVRVSLFLNGQPQDTVGAGVDTLIDIDNLVGSPFNDTLEAGGFVPYLGSPTDAGGFIPYPKSLTGGLGADTFVYQPFDGNVVITDFSHAQGDKIDLSHVWPLTNLQAVLAGAVQSGPNVVLSIPGLLLSDDTRLPGGSLILDNVDLNSLTASDFAFAPVIPGDFFGTGHASLFWQNSVNGLTSAWLLLDAAPAAGVSLPAAPGWQADDVGAFEGGPYAGDMVLRNTTTGMVDIWQDNNTVMSGHDVAQATLDWQIMGTADFNADGKSDILWRNEQNGYVSVWQMDGSTVTTTYNPGVVGLEWKMVGANDFYGDGKAEVLWRNSVTGEVNMWTIDGPGPGATHGQTVAFLGNEWKVAGTGDFNGDGRADILWFNTVTGQVVVWEMNGPEVTAAQPIGAPGPQWQVVDVADITGDGRADIVWRDTRLGQVIAWAMNGFNVDHYGSLGTVDNTWKVIHHNYDWA